MRSLLSDPIDPVEVDAVGRVEGGWSVREVGACQPLQEELPRETERLDEALAGLPAVAQAVPLRCS